MYKFTFYSFLISMVILVGADTVSAQVTGGKSVFTFMSLPSSARVTALGGSQITIMDGDVNFAHQNPALLNEEMNKTVSFQHNFHIGGVSSGYAAYARKIKKWDMMLHGGIQYISYGDIKMADEYGTVQGDVKASEQAITVGTSKQLSTKISLGLNLRFGNSSLAEFRSTSIGADIGATYQDTASNFAAALVVRNAGAQMSTYAGTREALPLDVQLGASKRLKYLPFRLGVIAHHLHQWDIRHNDPALNTNNILVFGGEDTSSEGNPAIDNFFRHFIFNGEFLFGKQENFRLMFGYNHLRKRELSIQDVRSLAGFSFGVGMKIKRFRVDFGYGAYHLGAKNVHLGVSGKF